MEDGSARKRPPTQGRRARSHRDPVRNLGQSGEADHDLWESGANGVEWKALVVHRGGRFSAKPEAVTEILFVVMVRYRGKDLMQVRAP